MCFLQNKKNTQRKSGNWVHCHQMLLKRIAPYFELFCGIINVNIIYTISGSCLGPNSHNLFGYYLGFLFVEIICTLRSFTTSAKI